MTSTHPHPGWRDSGLRWSVATDINRSWTDDPGLPGLDEALANIVSAGFRSLLADRGADLAFGHTLRRLLRDIGVDAVSADACFPVTDPTSVVLERATLEQVRSELVAAGSVTYEEVDRHLATLTAHQVDPSTAPLVSAWGRQLQKGAGGQRQ